MVWIVDESFRLFQSLYVQVLSFRSLIQSLPFSFGPPGISNWSESACDLLRSVRGLIIPLIYGSYSNIPNMPHTVHITKIGGTVN